MKTKCVTAGKYNVFFILLLWLWLIHNNSLDSNLNWIKFIAYAEILQFTCLDGSVFIHTHFFNTHIHTRTLIWLHRWDAVDGYKQNKNNPNTLNEMYILSEVRLAINQMATSFKSRALVRLIANRIERNHNKKKQQ